jgi:hypothetical protein
MKIFLIATVYISEDEDVPVSELTVEIITAEDIELARSLLVEALEREQLELPFDERVTIYLEENFSMGDEGIVIGKAKEFKKR